MNEHESAAITMQEIRRSFTYDNTVMLTLLIEYPQFQISASPAAQVRINGSVRSRALRFYHYAATTLYNLAVSDYRRAKENDFPFRTYDAVVTYKVTYNRDCNLSLFRDQYEYTGGAHGTTLRFSDTYSMRTGRQIPLSAYFYEGENPRKILIDEILRQAERNMAENPGIYFDDYRVLIRKNFRSENYYLTDEGIAIYYGQYEIAPYSTGIVTFVTPYKLVSKPPRC